MYLLAYVRENAERLKECYKLRGKQYPDLDEILSLDERCRKLRRELDEMRARRNREAEVVARAKKVSKSTADSPEIRQLADLRKAITESESELKKLAERLESLLLLVPQIPHQSVPVGPDASSNVILREQKETHGFPTAPKPHFVIGEEMNIIDEERGVKVAAEGFYFLVGDGARLEMALIQYMRDIHHAQGYIEVFPPILINTASMLGTGQLPKFAEDSYQVKLDDLWLCPTAEVPVTNMFRNEILLAEDLPLRMMAYTPCFRREASSHGVETRGIARVHQFNKVELVTFATPESSYEEHEALLGHAEEVVRQLGLRYRIVNLCTGDLPDKAAKC